MLSPCKSVSLFVLSAALVGCQAPLPIHPGEPEITTQVDDAAALRQRILEQVPPGTPIKQVEQTMHVQGYECVYGDASRHWYRRRKSPSWPASKELTICLHFDGFGKLREVEVRHKLED
jgi:hypothetical protein